MVITIKEKNSHIIFIKLIFWYGVFLACLITILMINYALKLTTILPYSNSNANFQHALGTAASLMFGWALFLLWASFKPIERKGALILTIFPVLFGFILTELIFAPTELIHLWIFQIFGCVFPFIIGYVILVKIEKFGDKKNNEYQK